MPCIIYFLLKCQWEDYQRSLSWAFCSPEKTVNCLFMENILHLLLPDVNKSCVYPGCLVLTASPRTILAKDNMAIRSFCRGGFSICKPGHRINSCQQEIYYRHMICISVSNSCVYCLLNCAASLLKVQIWHFLSNLLCFLLTRHD